MTALRPDSFIKRHTTCLKCLVFDHTTTDEDATYLSRTNHDVDRQLSVQVRRVQVTFSQIQI